MTKRGIAITIAAVGLAAMASLAGAQMRPGGQANGGPMQPGMRGGMGMHGQMGPMQGAMGSGARMQMQGMMQQMQGMLQQLAEALKAGTMSADQMKKLGEMMESMAAHAGRMHGMMSAMGPGGPPDRRVMHEHMAEMMRHMADMQHQMGELMESGPSAAPSAAPSEKR